MCFYYSFNTKDAPDKSKNAYGIWEHNCWGDILNYEATPWFCNVYMRGSAEFQRFGKHENNLQDELLGARCLSV